MRQKEMKFFFVMMIMCVLIIGCQMPDGVNDSGKLPSQEIEDDGSNTKPELIIEGYNLLDEEGIQAASVNLDLETLRLELGNSPDSIVSGAETEFMFGDVNSDGVVNIMDSLLIARYFAGMNQQFSI